MKKLLPYLTFICIVGLTTINGFPIYAGGCNSQLKKSEQLKCQENDKNCNLKKDSNYKFKNSSRT